MIYIAVALTSEAKPIIEYLKLKKDNSYTKVQVFKNERIILMITGAGMLKSAISASYVLAKNIITDLDLFVNIGTCGGSKEYKPGETIICNKIVDKQSGRESFPDMIYKHDFREGAVVSQLVPERSQSEKENNKLVDMEAYGLFQSASYFFMTYQMIFLKIVSDNFDFQTASAMNKQIELFIKNANTKIFTFINSACNIIKENKENNFFNDNEIKRIEQFCTDLKFTQTQKYEFVELMKYKKNKDNNILSFIDMQNKQINGTETNKALEKYKRNEIFEKLKKQIME